jgi:putative chitinase
MPKRTSKKVTRSEPVSKLSEKTKQTSASMLNFNQAAPKALEQTDGAVDGVLGKIYQLMVDNRKDELDQRKKDESINQTDLKKEEQRHQELLKALTVRRRPQPKRVIRREKKAEEKEAKKVPEPTKPTAPAKKPVEPAKKPVEPAKKPEPVKKVEPAKPAEVKPPPKAEPVKPPEVKPPPKAEAAPAAPKPVQVKPPPKAEQVKPPPKAPTAKIPPISGGKGIVIAALAAAGLSAKAQANVLAQVEAESNFVPKSENLNYSADGLANTWPNRFGQKGPDGKLSKNEKGRVLPNQIATDIEKNPEKIAEAVYGKRKDLGNTADGDGFKYRGRGFLQITGKDAYKSLGDYIGVDLVGDPDKLNEASVAAKSIPWFFLKYKGKKPQDLENIGTVSKAVGFQDKKLKSGEMESEHRAKLAEKYQAEVSSTPIPSSDTGTKVDQSSKENADLKEKLNKDKSAQTTNNTTTTNNQTNNVKPEQKVDDRPPHVRKQQQ